MRATTGIPSANGPPGYQRLTPASRRLARCLFVGLLVTGNWPWVIPAPLFAQERGPGNGFAAGVAFRGPAVSAEHRGAGIAIRVARERPLSANLGWRTVGLAAFTTSAAEGARAWGFNGFAGIAAGPKARGQGPYLRLGAGAVGITTSEPGTGGRTEEIALALGGYGAAGVELRIGQRLAFVEGFAVVPSTGKFGSAFLGVLLGARDQTRR